MLSEQGLGLCSCCSFYVPVIEERVSQLPLVWMLYSCYVKQETTVICAAFDQTFLQCFAAGKQNNTVTNFKLTKYA